MNNVIENLYDLRLKLKNKNPARIVIKLLMNSMHGETIIKPVGTDTIINNSRDDFEKCISFNYAYFGSFLEVNVRYYVKQVKSVMSHFNYVHCGVEILSMFKRVMDKVIDCANDCSIKFFLSRY